MPNAKNECPYWNASFRLGILHFAFCIGSHLRQPPDTGGMNATSSPSATAADIFA
jgi:hypothetical protein